MPVTPYQPMAPAKRCTSTEDMWETLAKRAKPQVSIQPLQAAQSPKAKVSLEWGLPVWTSARGPEGSGYLPTACGRFSISKDAHELGFTYTAWKRDKQPAMNLGCRRTSDEAKLLCEADELESEASK